MIENFDPNEDYTSEQINIEALYVNHKLHIEDSDGYPLQIRKLVLSQKGHVTIVVRT